MKWFVNIRLMHVHATLVLLQFLTEKTSCQTNRSPRVSYTTGYTLYRNNVRARRINYTHVYILYIFYFIYFIYTGTRRKSIFYFLFNYTFYEYHNTNYWNGYRKTVREREREIRFKTKKNYYKFHTEQFRRITIMR